jgi:FkbM family methyltransferase
MVPHAGESRQAGGGALVILNAQLESGKTSMVQSRVRSVAVASYGRVLNALYSKRGLPWRVHDEVVRIDPRVRHLVPHEPEPALFAFLKETIRPGDVVLDVGAFAGIYAVLAARWSAPDGRVIAFEPTPSSAALARRHLAFNGVELDCVRLVEAAVADRAGRGSLHVYDDTLMPYVNSLVPAVDTNASPVVRDVAVVTIDDVCRELGVVPSVIRMDVQGAEMAALRGARETIRAAGRLTLVVEMHPQCWPAFGVTESSARETLGELGLTARPLVEGEPLFGRDAHAVLNVTAHPGEQVPAAGALQDRSLPA